MWWSKTGGSKLSFPKVYQQKLFHMPRLQFANHTICHPDIRPCCCHLTLTITNKSLRDALERIWKGAAVA